MAKLEYSKDAINSLNKFYRCDTIVYVEGDDDALFWTTIFEKLAEVKIAIQSMGGSYELDSFIDRIIEEDLKVIAARDADFLRLCNRHRTDPRVLYTYGYSIENTLYTHESIFRISQIWSKGKNKAKEPDCINWLNSFHKEAEELITYDAANFLFNCGLSVTGENIARFSKKSIPYSIDENKVQKHIEAFQGAISNEMLGKVQECEFIKMGGAVTNWIRGHFLASAVLQYVSHQIKSAGLSTKITYDGMYANAIEHFSNHLDKQHPHRDYYRESAVTAVASL